MDVGRFLTLLKTKALYFARRHEVEDAWEGARPATLIGSIAARYASASGNVIASYNTAADEAIFNCWHKNDDESLAMWRLYLSGKEGVAIQTTIQRLQDTLQNEPRSVIIAKVEYVNYESGEPGPGADTFDVLGPLLCKRRSLTHENEVRVLIPNPDEDKGITANDNAGGTFAIHGGKARKGESISIDLATLIQRIVLSPEYPTWGFGALQDVVDRSGLSIDLEQSDLIEGPEAVNSLFGSRSPGL